MAHQFRARAEELAAVARRVGHLAETTSWQGPKAERQRAAMRDKQRRAELLAQELASLSLDLRRLAARVAAELRDLSRLEAAVRNVVRTFLPESGIAPWEGRGWDPRRLPGSGDPHWRDIARSIGLR